MLASGSSPHPAPLCPLQVSWAPMLGALSMLFDEYQEGRQVLVCLQGISASCCLTAQVGAPGGEGCPQVLKQVQ